jgi:hypothetical protein
MPCSVWNYRGRECQNSTSVFSLARCSSPGILTRLGTCIAMGVARSCALFLYLVGIFYSAYGLAREALSPMLLLWEAVFLLLTAHLEYRSTPPGRRCLCGGHYFQPCPDNCRVILLLFSYSPLLSVFDTVRMDAMVSTTNNTTPHENFPHQQRCAGH